MAFATKSRSVENLNVSLRQSWTPCSRHTRATVACSIFRCSASSRELQLGDAVFRRWRCECDRNQILAVEGAWTSRSFLVEQSCGGAVEVDHGL